MKPLIFTVFFILLLLFPLKSNHNNIDFTFEPFIIEEIENFGELYEDKGDVVKIISDDELIFLNVKIYKKQLTSQTQKSFKSYDEERYGYSIVIISESRYLNELTSTWLYGFWVKVNGVLVSRALYPNGKDLLVYTTPTKVYYFETHEDNVPIRIGWLESVYEPKLIK